MDGRLKVGHTYSQTGEYGINELTVLLLREKELAKGDIIYIEHPKNGLPVVYQVTRVFPHKRVREYEAALLSEGMVVNDFNDSTLLAKAYHWGWMDKDGSLRPLRYPITPNTQVYLADREIIAKFTKPNSDWKLLLGTDPSTDLDVELGIYPLIRQSCLICGAVGTGKTTTAVSMVARAVIADPPWEDYLGEFGWQKTWWNAKILIQALKMLYRKSTSVTKANLTRALCNINPEILGFNKKPDEYLSYKQQVENAISGSKLIPSGDLEPLDPVDLLKEKRIVIMDLSQGKDSWRQKHLVVAQVLRRIFSEALENRKFGCIVVLEEAMYYAPQRGVFEIGERESRGKLLGVIKEIATNGGRNGVGLWIVTQRLSTVEKTVVTQCANNIICHSLEDIDKQRLSEIIGNQFADLISDLPPGEAIVKGTALKCRFPIWVKVLPEVYPASSMSTPVSRFIHMEMENALARVVRLNA
jgi:DNA helicase HerA-like ATPase